MDSPRVWARVGVDGRKKVRGGGCSMTRRASTGDRGFGTPSLISILHVYISLIATKPSSKSSALANALLFYIPRLNRADFSSSSPRPLVLQTTATEHSRSTKQCGHRTTGNMPGQVRFNRQTPCSLTQNLGRMTLYTNLTARALSGTLILSHQQQLKSGGIVMRQAVRLASATEYSLDKY